jgi:hydroxyacylglutathione hydrolase
MFLKYFYDKPLAQASYLIGCQHSGEALVIDPLRNTEPYRQAAAAEGLKITAAAETHIHADFVSGSRELADGVGAKLYLSDEGPADWKYGFAGQHDTQLVRHGDVIRVGRVTLEVWHTPGHTPEHVSFLLTDKGGGADGPMGIFTGDFVFVGSIGRPDLLESAAGVIGSAESGAKLLYGSMRKFRELPDHLQVWPGHGAGSACGKGLGAIPSSTVGYEKRFNPALQFTDEPSFVRYILADQPETPPYFAVMKRVNKVGPELTRNLSIRDAPALDSLPGITRDGQLLDVRPAAEFAAGHVAGAINIPQKMLEHWAGFLIQYDRPVHLIADHRQLPEVLNSLRAIGIDNVAAVFDPASVKSSGLAVESYSNESPHQLQHRIRQREVQLIDVRSASEFNEGRIPEAQHRFLGSLSRELSQLDPACPVVVQCLGGTRSPIAASILQRAGFRVINMTGGLRAWSTAGLATEQRQRS